MSKEKIGLTASEVIGMNSEGFGLASMKIEGDLWLDNFPSDCLLFKESELELAKSKGYKSVASGTYDGVFYNVMKKIGNSYKTNGHYVLVEVLEVKNKSAGGIILGDTEREQMACEYGRIVSFGPTAFVGISGCDPDKYPTNDPRYKMTPYQLWGVDVGDQVQFSRMEGVIVRDPDGRNLRAIPDVKIIVSISGEIELHKGKF